MSGGGTYKTGRRLCLAVAVDQSALEPSIGQQRGVGAQIGLRNTAQADGGHFPIAGIPVRLKACDRISRRRSGQQEPVRILQEQFLYVWKFSLRNNKRVQQTGVCQLRFQLIPCRLRQVGREINGFIKSSVWNSLHDELGTRGLNLGAPRGNGFRVAENLASLPLMCIVFILQRSQLGLYTLFCILKDGALSQ